MSLHILFSLKDLFLASGVRKISAHVSFDLKRFKVRNMTLVLILGVLMLDFLVLRAVAYSINNILLT